MKNIRMKIRLIIFSYKNPPKKSFVMKILAPGNPTVIQIVSYGPKNAMIKHESYLSLKIGN